MWNSEAPLKLLSSMPAQLNIENLRDIQQIIDVDKYEHSTQFGRDLCGEYAPFCEGCNKSVKYPCAVSYVKMKQAEGLEVEIAATDDELSLEEEAVEEVPAEEPVAEEPAQEVSEPKKYIRIAIARRKH